MIFAGFFNLSWNRFQQFLRTCVQLTLPVIYILHPQAMDMEKKIKNVHNMDHNLAMRMAQVDKMYEDY